MDQHLEVGDRDARDRHQPPIQLGNEPRVATHIRPPGPLLIIIKPHTVPVDHPTRLLL